MLTPKYDIAIKREYAQALLTSKQPGFALVAVLFLSVIITAMIPMMINFNRESITSVQRGQSQAVAAEYAKQIFMMAHTELMMHQGLPQGWTKGNSPILPRPQRLMILAIVPAILIWMKHGTVPMRGFRGCRLMNAASAANDSKVIAGVTRASYGDVPYDHFIVLGCVITGGRLSQGAVMRGEFAISGQQILMLSLSSNTS